MNPKKLFRCLNPEHEDRNPSMGYYNKKDICKCFGCRASYDIFDLIKMDFGLDSFPEQIEKAKELYNILDEDQSCEDKKEIEEERIIDYSKYFSYCHKNIAQTDYLEKRGIDPRLFSKYYIGYSPNKKRIVFPINKNCYCARNIENNLKLKSGGKSCIWNEKLFEDSSSDLIYVTESIIDGLSLETVKEDIKVVSLNGTTNIKSLLDLVQEKNFKGFLVLVFDKDWAGRKAQQELKEELEKLNITSFATTLIENFDDNCKDLNEALLLDREKLKKNILYYDKVIQNYINVKSQKMEDDIEL